jgi:ketosteroid isomerase-like protein
MHAICILLSSIAADPAGDIARLLDDWHLAAAQADEKRYFAYLGADAVFLGTDASERWTKSEFQKFAHPYFVKGKAWSFKCVRRTISLSKDGQVAWFEENLDTPNMGPCRGSGVLTRDGGDWKIAQYNLALTIPNEKMAKVKKLLDEK